MKIYPETYIKGQNQMCENYNIQHYEPGEGFKDWHFEKKDDLNSKADKMVLEGKKNGTHFKYQNLKTE